MRKLIAASVVLVTLSGCVANQSRENDRRDVFEGGDIETEVYRHGSSGYVINQLFNSGEIADAMEDSSGADRGLQVDEFYAVEIARDPLRPTVLESVGYVRLLEEDRGELMVYEFYDIHWDRIAYLSESGKLYRYDTGEEKFLGKHQLDGAVATLFPAPDAYGYDSVLQDRSIANMRDPDVVGAGSRGRGVYHRSHKAAPPVISYTLYRPGEAALLADRWERERFDERMREKYQRIKEEQGVKSESLDDAYSSDTEYEWKDGQPYKDGRPVRPHSKNGD